MKATGLRARSRPSCRKVCASPHFNMTTAHAFNRVISSRDSCVCVDIRISDIKICGLSGSHGILTWVKMTWVKMTPGTVIFTQGWIR